MHYSTEEEKGKPKGMYSEAEIIGAIEQTEAGADVVSSWPPGELSVSKHTIPAEFGAG
jgi:hypothetical protein